MSRKGHPNVATKLITDDFGDCLLYRRCGYCRHWFELRIGNFSPRKRDEKRHVVRWDARCLGCRSKQRREVWAHMSAEERKRASRKGWQRIKSDPVELARRRVENARNMARRRQDPELAERMRAQHRAYYARVKADPAAYAAYLERARMNHRLRQERAGRRLESIRRNSMVVYSPEPRNWGYLPAKPLAEAIDHHPIILGALNTDALLSKIGIEPRSVRAWRNGERESVQLTVADLALTRLGLTWCDVWPPERFPEVLAVFEEAA